jgi:CheY-like chemotaxis protein
MIRSLAARLDSATERWTRADTAYRQSRDTLRGSAWRVSCSRLAMDYPRLRHIHGSSNKPETLTTVLIVDDLPDARYSMGRSLGAAGFDVRETASGRDALRLAHLPPQLIILDVVLRDLDGIEVLRRLKASPVTKNVPVILKSAVRREDGHLKQALAAGAAAYFTDTHDPAALLAVVRQVLGAGDEPAAAGA